MRRTRTTAGSPKTFPVFWFFSENDVDNEEDEEEENVIDLKVQDADADENSSRGSTLLSEIGEPSGGEGMSSPDSGNLERSNQNVVDVGAHIRSCSGPSGDESDESFNSKPLDFLDGNAPGQRVHSLSAAIHEGGESPRSSATTPISSRFLTENSRLGTPSAKLLLQPDAKILVSFKLAPTTGSYQDFAFDSFLSEVASILSVEKTQLAVLPKDKSMTAVSLEFTPHLHLFPGSACGRVAECFWAMIVHRNVELVEGVFTRSIDFDYRPLMSVGGWREWILIC